MPTLEKRHPKGIHTFILFLVVVMTSQSACSFFKKRRPKGDEASQTYGVSLGEKAGGADEAKLAEIYAISTSHAPAGVRPDPDLFVQQALKQFHDEGSTIARQTGAVASYKMLLGGASDDFAVAPQETYDATSLLALIKVSEQVCAALVAPTPGMQGDWLSILPAPASDKTGNLRFLVQRLVGVPSANVDADSLTKLSAIVDAAASSRGGLTPEAYVSACAAVLVDARGLLL